MDYVDSHDPRNCPTALPYAARVLAFAIRPAKALHELPPPPADGEEQRGFAGIVKSSRVGDQAGRR